MKHWKFGFLVFLAAAIVISGCTKKSTEQANLTGTGFDSLSSSEELAQLPQSNTTTQQASVEVLPIETSPVTQSINASASTIAPVESAAATTDASGLSQSQKIQTALKNAGLYNGNIDGKIGPNTKKAIETFQQNNGLKVDGKVGPKTWTALEPYVNGAPATAVSQTAQQ
jgi:peptidoglycan hydrolase-like protein with peptidoglycan-binding domain